MFIDKDNNRYKIYMRIQRRRLYELYTKDLTDSTDSRLKAKEITLLFIRK